MTEKDIIEIEKFYIEYKDRLFGYAVSMVSNRTVAEDVVHSVFRKILNKGKIPENLKAYIYRSIRNEVIDIWRKPRFLSQEEIIFEEGYYENNDKAEETNYYLKRLELKEKEIIILKIYNDMTFAEIAEVLKESINTVSSRYRRGLEKLRKDMEGDKSGK